MELAPSTSSTAAPPADGGGGERVPGFDEVDDRPPSSTVVTQKEEVTEQIIDQGESISESTNKANMCVRPPDGISMKMQAPGRAPIWVFAPSRRFVFV